MTSLTLLQLSGMLCEAPLVELRWAVPVRRTGAIEGVLCDFMARTVVDSTGCWEWVMKKRKSGYGVFYQLGAHRVSAALFVGPSGGLHTLHDCDNRWCVNPAHLHYGTQKQNVREAVDRGLLVNTPGWKHTAEAIEKIAVCSRGARNPMHGVHISGPAHHQFGVPRTRETCERMSRGMQERYRRAAGDLPWAVLTPENVRWIRSPESAHLSSYKLADLLGVDRSSINNVRSGKTWKYLPQVEAVCDV